MHGGKSPKTQPFSEHVRELRRRALYTIATLLLGSVAGFFMHEQIFSIIRRPLNEQLYYTTPTGGFNAIIKVSIMFGAILTVPVLVYHIGKFLSPAFRRRFRAVRIVLFSTTLAMLGVLFAYYVSLPAAIHFLANIDSKNLQSMITVNEYLGFVTAYLAGFAILFQLPLIMIFLNRIKPQRPGRLMRMQRWVILISFIVAAILTPTPDPFNHLIMAAPVILLYPVSVVLIWIINRKNKVPALAIAQPQTIVAPTANPKPAYPKSAKKQKSNLIMDIYWQPHNPGT